MFASVIKSSLCAFQYMPNASMIKSSLCAFQYMPKTLKENESISYHTTCIRYVIATNQRVVAAKRQQLG